MAQFPAFLSVRNRNEIEICHSELPECKCPCADKYQISTARLIAVTASQTRVEILLTQNPPSLTSSAAYFVYLGKKRIARKDLRIDYFTSTITFEAEASELAGVDRIQLTAPFWRDCDPSPHTLDFGDFFSVSKVELVSKFNERVLLALRGEHLSQVKLLSPEVKPFTPMPDQASTWPEQVATIAFVEIEGSKLTGVESLVLQKGSGPPITVVLPSAVKGEQPPKP